LALGERVAGDLHGLDPAAAQDDVTHVGFIRLAGQPLNDPAQQTILGRTLV